MQKVRIFNFLLEKVVYEYQRYWGGCQLDPFKIKKMQLILHSKSKCFKTFRKNLIYNGKSFHSTPQKKAANITVAMVFESSFKFSVSYLMVIMCHELRLKRKEKRNVKCLSFPFYLRICTMKMICLNSMAKLNR